jgi:hypothetical protein
MIEVLRGASSLITAEALYESGGESFANIKTTGVSLQALARKLSEAYNLAQEKGATDEEIRMISDAAAEDIISNTYADDVDFLEKLTEQQQIASVQKQGKDLVMTLGYSHPVVMSDNDDIKIEVPDQFHIVVTGIDKQKVGQFAAEVREKRPPEPYKGKGIRYVGEFVAHKEGKTGKGK